MANTFEVGQKVFKHDGDYQSEGVVVGTSTTKAGKTLYSVELAPGLVHLYSEKNLRLLTGASLERQYLDLLRRALDGNPRACRNGSTRAVFAQQLRHNMADGFPLLTTKKMAWKTIVGELLWFLEGGVNSPVPYRLDNNRLAELCGGLPGDNTIWSHDCEKPAWRAKAQFPGDCGRIYGAQWRNWNGLVDQLAQLVERLKTDPSSRYHKVTAWNPDELDRMCLPPCHGDFQCFVRFAGGERLLSLHMNQRSCDLFLGVPFNIASYALLLQMLAQQTGMVADELVITLNDCHIYEAHLDAVTEQLQRDPRTLPFVEVLPRPDLFSYAPTSFTLHDYQHHPAIKAPLL